MKPEWAERVQEQAAAAGCQFFFKQWGAWGPDGQRRHKAANGRLLKGQTWDAMPARRAIHTENISQPSAGATMPA